MRKLILSSAILALATAFTPSVAFAVDTTTLETLIANVRSGQVSIEAAAGSFGGDLAAANDIVAALVQAFPDQAAEITASAVSSIAASGLGGDALQSAVANLVASVSSALSQSGLSGEGLTVAINNCLTSTETALTNAGVSAGAAGTIMAASSAAASTATGGGFSGTGGTVIAAPDGGATGGGQGGGIGGANQGGAVPPVVSTRPDGSPATP